MKKILFTLAMMLMAIGANAQMKIVTGHPDLRVKLLRCVASDKTVVMDFVFSNDGSRDCRLLYVGGGYYGSQAFDDDANAYNGQDVKVSVGKERLTDGGSSNAFPAETSLKVRVQIENVSLSATEFTRLNLGVSVEEFGMDGRAKPMKLYHIPITRE